MGPIELAREIRCSADRALLWRALADTARFSQYLDGTPLVAIEPVSDDTAVRFLVTTRAGRSPVAFYERPFEWKIGEYILVSRTHKSGPATGYRFEIRLEALADGATLVRLTMIIEPRSLVTRAVIRVIGARVATRSERLVEAIDSNLRDGRDPYSGAPTTPADEESLARGRATLREAVPAAWAPLAERIADYAARAPDIDATRIRPYELADTWKVDRRTLLRVCLHAVTAGILELSWELVCPSCRIAAERVEELVDLREDVHCQYCDLTAALDVERSVEATLRPARGLRSVPQGHYCISGPFLTPHVHQQAILAAGGSASLQAPKEPGRYRLFARGGATASVHVGTVDDPSEVRLTVGSSFEPVELTVAPEAEIIVHDKLEVERHIKLEYLQWASLAATAHDVTALPEFRRLFSAQVLRKGVRLSVGRVCFVFSDIVGSTRLYEELGDAHAYRVVQDHFDLLERVADEHDGTVIKTIGDSIMVAFHDSLSGVRAALAMQAAHAQALPTNDDTSPIGLRIGVNTGPCYLVSFTQGLDYFGQTVNLASRLEAEAKIGEVAIAAQLWDQVSHDPALSKATIRRRDLQLRGTSNALGVVFASAPHRASRDDLGLGDPSDIRRELAGR